MNQHDTNYYSGAEFQVTITYETAPTCSALQWLEPAQTAGKTLPYLYTQCQVRKYILLGL